MKCLRYYSVLTKRLVKPSDLTTADALDIIESANHLKQLHASKNLQIDLQDKRFVYLTIQDTLHYATIAAAANLLRTKVEKIVDPNWDRNPQLQTVRNYLEENADFIFLQSRYFERIDKMSENSKIPIVSVMCYKFTLIRTLINIMTINQHYGYLKGLTLTFIGPPCKMINTCLTLVSGVGLNVRYICAMVKNSPMSPLCLHEALQQKERGSLDEFTELAGAIKGTNVILLRSEGVRQFNVSANDIKDVANNCCIIQDLPGIGTNIEVGSRVKDITLENAFNGKYVVAAVILKLLNDNSWRYSIRDFGESSNLQ